MYNPTLHQPIPLKQARSKATSRGLLMRRNFDKCNAEAAQIIIADRERFGGMEAGLVRWAYLALGRLQPQSNLFEGAA